MASIVQLAAPLGVSEQDLATYEARPEGSTYATFVAWQSVYASAAEDYEGEGEGEDR